MLKITLQMDVEKWNVGGKIKFDFLFISTIWSFVLKIEERSNCYSQSKNCIVNEFDRGCLGKCHLQRAIKAALIFEQKLTLIFKKTIWHFLSGKKNAIFEISIQ